VEWWSFAVWPVLLVKVKTPAPEVGVGVGVTVGVPDGVIVGVTEGVASQSEPMAPPKIVQLKQMGRSMPVWVPK
jgi:hypothetical protein